MRLLQAALIPVTTHVEGLNTSSRNKITKGGLRQAQDRSRTWPSRPTPHKASRKAPKHRTSQRTATIREQKLSPMPSAQSQNTCTVLTRTLWAIENETDKIKIK